MRAYFTEGEPIGDPDARPPRASRSACPRTRCATSSPPTATRPRSARTSARPWRSGSHAVPFFVVDRRIGAAGAQPAEALGELLRRG